MHYRKVRVIIDTCMKNAMQISDADCVQDAPGCPVIRSGAMKIPVVWMAANKSGAKVRLRYADCRPLPASYMSEHSVLGLVVDDIAEAVRILGGNGFRISPEAFGAEVEVDDTAQLPEIVGMLARAGLCCTMGDVIDSVYQG